MRYLSGVLLLIVTTAGHTLAGNTDSLNTDSAQLQRYGKEPTEFVTTPLDSALNAWQDRVRTYDTSKAGEPNALLANRIPTFSDSFFRQKLQQLDETSPIAYSYNKHVKPFIVLYAADRRDQVERMMGRGHLYFPMFAQELDKRGLPLRLKYLPVIESALNPHAVSSMGANGLWQFMYGTAKYIGLDISTYIDERRDPVKATRAAASYLSDLHDIYDDWLLVIAAYNCGPGNVNKAIRRAGYSDDFWKIYPFLPRETRGYVPAFIAATHVMEHHAVYRLFPRAVDIPMNTEAVMVEGPMPMSNLAKGLDVPKATLKALNPSYKRDFIPGGDQLHSVRLPKAQALAFERRKEQLYAMRDSLARGEDNSSDEGSEDNGDSPYSAVYYTVKSGDNLGYIAEWYDCSAANLRRWNNMRGSRIAPGQRLKVIVPTEDADTYKQLNNLSFQQKQYFARTGKLQQQEATTAESDYVYYEVQRGDTLWGIARQFQGISVYKLKQLNDIRSSQSLKPGQQIKIQEKG
jgi:membrane-bound lytic murein transglycosylase D